MTSYELPWNRLSRGSSWYKWIWWGLFIGLVIYQLSGIFPITTFEGDGVAIAVGANSFDTFGFGDTPLTYRYSFQSFTYVFIYILSKLLHLPTFPVFSILGALSAIGYVLLSAALVKQFSGLSYPLSGLIILSFQEAMAAAYYPNTNVIAAFLVTGGLMALKSATGYTPSLPGMAQRSVVYSKAFWSILSVILIALGVLARIDSIIIIAPFLVIFLYHRKPGRYDWLAVPGFFIVVAIWIYSFNLDPSFALKVAGRHLGTHYYLGLISKSYLSFFSLAGIWLICLGCIYLIAHRRFFVLILALAGILPSVVMYSQTMTTPKYLLYTLPYWGLLAAFSALSLQSIRPSISRVLKVITAGLFVAQYIFGVQVSAPTLSSPKYPAAPELLPLLHLQSPSRAIEAEIVIGAGQPVYTHDQYRLTSGILFSPSYWSSAKTLHNQEVEHLCSQIDSHQVHDLRFYLDGEKSKTLLYCAQERGFVCDRLPNVDTVQFSCQNNAATLQIYVHQQTK